MSRADDEFDSCDCCQGVSGLTPLQHVNRQGLSALAYRVGTHGSFKATMQACIGPMPALSALGTRDDGDFTIALMDAWASVADVLSFYTERIANEGFLGTATESLSVRKLAQSIGYEPPPGVAASTYLAFTVEDAPGVPELVPIPKGTRAQSNPDGDELPQTFETSEAMTARPAWNALRPRQTEPQRLTRDICVDNRCSLYFEGTNTGFAQGDWMLLRLSENTDPENPGEISNIPVRVQRVEINQEKQHTRVELERPPTPTPDFDGPLIVGLNTSAPSPPPVVFTEPFTLSASSAAELAASYTWTLDDQELFEQMHFLDAGAFAEFVNKRSEDGASSGELGAFAMRVRSAPFGHNAPRWNTLPREWRLPAEDDSGGEGGGGLTGPGDLVLDTDPGDGGLTDGSGELVSNEVVGTTDNVPYPHDWDHPSSPWPFHAASSGINDLYTGIYGDPDSGNEVILLAASFPEIVSGSWILIMGSGDDAESASFRVLQTEQVSRADFALNGEVTALTLEPGVDQPALEAFHLRTTTIYARSEALPLAERPIETPVQGDSIEFDQMPGIRPGQAVIVSGIPTDEEGMENELAIVQQAFDQRLVFESPLSRAYRRDSVRLNANVAPATHGESRQEILGAGNASQSFQAFQLSQPLTYVSAPVPGGAQSTLELRVNDARWDEAANLFQLGPGDRHYVLRQDEKGMTRVGFGDGLAGERPPTGFENIAASYRTGLGAAGNLAAGKITLLASLPRYVREVTNPVPASGGVDPESRQDARRNAPNSVRTFGRIITLGDFEDFARAFAGVAKAKACHLHVGEENLVHLTIAGEDGEPIATDSATYRDLVDAMNLVRDPFQRLQVASYERRFFDVAAKVRVVAEYLSETVFEAILTRLRETFSFAQRELAQGVTVSEIVAVMQRVKGVEAVDLDRLRSSHDKDSLPTGRPSDASGFDDIEAFGRVFWLRVSPKTQPRVLASRARLGPGGSIRPAQHLSIGKIQLREMP